MNTRALLVNTVLNNKYRIKMILGEGGFGITYLATDLLINEKVAIKEYFPSIYGTRDSSSTNNKDVILITGDCADSFNKGLNRFEEEAATLARFNGEPGIVHVKNFFRENNTGYMVMEYIEGMTLSEYLKRSGGKISCEQAVDMMKPVMDSLSVVHAQGIIHRDISPENIMVTRSGQLKLIDFGTARYVGQDEKSLTVMLKQGYAPPEQYRSDGNQGPWTDVYAICATLYKMISGKTPTESIERVIGANNLVSLHKLYPEVPEKISKIIERGMAVDTDKRWKSVGMLKTEFAGNKTKKIIKIVISIAVCFLIAELAVLFAMSLSSKKTVNLSEFASEVEEVDENQDDGNANDTTISTDEGENSEGNRNDGELAEENNTDDNGEKDKTDEESDQAKEEKLLEKIKTTSEEEIRSYLYDDFDDDGTKEMFALAGLLPSDDVSPDNNGQVWFANDECCLMVTDLKTIDTFYFYNSDVEYIQLGRAKHAIVSGYGPTGYSGTEQTHFALVEGVPQIVYRGTSLFYSNDQAVSFKIIRYDNPYSCYTPDLFYEFFPMFYLDGKYYVYDMKEISYKEFLEYGNADTELDNAISEIKKESAPGHYGDEYFYKDYPYVDITSIYRCDNGHIYVNLSFFKSEDDCQGFKDGRYDEFSDISVIIGSLDFNEEKGNLSFVATESEWYGNPKERKKKNQELYTFEIYTK